jgi:ankyrin repeat protein
MQVDGLTALHMTAANGHTDTVKALLAAGANVSATAVRGLVSRVCGGPLWRPATRAVYRACSLAVTLGCFSLGRCVSKRSPSPRLSLRLLSAVPCGIAIS